MELGGGDLMDQVRENRPELPVIVMSGYPTCDTISDRMVKGAANSIVMSFTPDELLKSANCVLQGRSQT